MTQISVQNNLENTSRQVPRLTEGVAGPVDRS